MLIRNIQCITFVFLTNTFYIVFKCRKTFSQNLVEILTSNEKMLWKEYSICSKILNRLGTEHFCKFQWTPSNRWDEPRKPYFVFKYLNQNNFNWKHDNYARYWSVLLNFKEILQAFLRRAGKKSQYFINVTLTKLLFADNMQIYAWNCTSTKFYWNAFRFCWVYAVFQQYFSDIMAAVNLTSVPGFCTSTNPVSASNYQLPHMNQRWRTNDLKHSVPHQIVTKK